MIDLNREAGPTAIEVGGTSIDGREAIGTLAVTVQAKEFPSEELKVAPKYVTPPPEVAERLDKERAKLKALYARRTSLDPLDAPFARPVPGDATSVFGTRRLYNGKPRSPHPGLDLRAGEGTPVHAPGPGQVVLAQNLYYSGNTVILDHGGGLFTIYAHLSFIQVTEGSAVEPGQVIGLSGATGRVTGPHLHWGAKIGNSPFDPMALLDPALYP
jgi:murein DD-endopeptidase MepM/ murein hydrolase activator NlpD